MVDILTVEIKVADLPEVKAEVDKLVEKIKLLELDNMLLKSDNTRLREYEWLYSNLVK